MANQRKLTQTRVDKERTPGRYSDGGGLYLLVKPTGAKSWVFRYRDRITQKLRDHGLGSCTDVPLSTARVQAIRLRAALVQGGNPIDDKKAAVGAARAAQARMVTFWYCAERYIEVRRGKWHNAKHASQWTNTLADYCSEWKQLPVSSINEAMVEAALAARWATHNETARRVQQRIAAVMDWATTRGYRTGPNPARWKGNLSILLPLPQRKVKPRPALPYDELPSFIAELRGKSSLSAKALTLQILTAVRPAEAAEARWEEFDFTKKLWTVPANRMKIKDKGDHLVPLSPQLVDFLQSGWTGERLGPLFPGKRNGSICTDTMLNLAKSMRPGITSHGFRSTFRDWAAEKTDATLEAEVCLAHTLDKVVAAYLRTSMLEKRSTLMNKWADHCHSTFAAA
jgi:integrase